MSIVDVLVFWVESIADLLAHGFVPIAGGVSIVDISCRSIAVLSL